MRAAPCQAQAHHMAFVSMPAAHSTRRTGAVSCRQRKDIVYAGCVLRMVNMCTSSLRCKRSTSALQFSTHVSPWHASRAALSDHAASYCKANFVIAQVSRYSRTDGASWQRRPDVASCDRPVRRRIWQGKCTPTHPFAEGKVFPKLR